MVIQHVTIADFEILQSSKDTRGGTIAVTLGCHRQTSRLYAVKTLPFSSTKERNDARLERHILETLKPLNNPSLSHLHWTFEHEHHLYFVMVIFVI
jgi:serine/threonine protein kinase